MDLPRERPVPAAQSAHRRHRPLVLIGHNTVNGRLKVREQREPDACSDAVGLPQDAVVCERVIIKEETRCDVERYENVDRVVLVCGQDEEYCKRIQDPTDCVQQRDSSRRICDNIMISTSSVDCPIQCQSALNGALSTCSRVHAPQMDLYPQEHDYRFYKDKKAYLMQW